MQPLEPIADWKYPDGQGVWLTEPGFCTKNPGEAKVHWPCPVRGWNEPAAQAVWALAAVVFTKYPAEASRQVACPVWGW